MLDSVVLTPAIYRTHVLVIGTDRTHARVMPLDHSCVLYTAVLWSLAFTHVNTRAHAFLAPAPPRLIARIQRSRTSRRTFSAPRARSPRRAACPPTAPTPRRAACPSPKKCRAHSAARRAQAWQRTAVRGCGCARVCPSKCAGGVESACCAPSPGGAGCSGRRSCRRCSRKALTLSNPLAPWALQGFNEALLDEGIPDGTEVTITFAFPTMTDEMCTAACAISLAACMDVRSRARALSL